MSPYISVVDWDRFQHYKDRGPLWIKVYTALMSSDEYLELSLAERGLLSGIWLEYARTSCQLPADTLRLSRRLGAQVLGKQLDALIQAGFLTIVASKTLANGYQAASTHARPVETETEIEESTTPSSALSSTSGSEEAAPADSAATPRRPALSCSYMYAEGPCGIEFKTEEALEAHRYNVHEPVVRVEDNGEAHTLSPREALLLKQGEGLPF